MAEENDDKTKTVTREEYEKLLETHNRVLEEGRTYKKSSQIALGEFESQNRERLEKENDFKSLHEKAESRIKGLENDLLNEQYNTFDKNLALEVSKLAKDAYNPIQVMRALSITAENTDLKGGTLHDLATQLDTLRKEEVNLFIPQQAKQTSSVPRFQNQETGEQAKKISEMTVEESIEALRNHKK